jgi:hypothetical protein
VQSQSGRGVTPSSNASASRPLFFNGARWAPWLLVPSLAAGGAVAWIQGIDALTATPVAIVLMACYWEAQMNKAESGWTIFRALGSALLLACAALPLAVAGGWQLQRTGPLALGGAGMQDLVELALPLIRQVEVRTAAGTKLPGSTRGLILPPHAPVATLVSATGEIVLIREQPYAVLILRPAPTSRFGAYKVVWRCSGGPVQSLPWLCDR